jgi:mevalonate kinase
MTSRTGSHSAVAPGKVILFGEHAVNRGQSAVAASVGLYARCRATPGGEGYRFRSRQREQSGPREAVRAVAERVEAYRATEDYEAIRSLARDDYFAPQKYVLASMFGEALPRGLELEWESDIPSSSGLGSGGAAFTAMVTR